MPCPYIKFKTETKNDMFTKIEIENFRGISKLVLDDIKQVNLVVGKNNTGKTSILEAIFLISGISNPQLPFNINTTRGLNFLSDKEEAFLIYHKLNYKNQLKIKAERNKQIRELKIKPHFIQTEGEITATIEKDFLGKNLLNTVLNNQPTDGYDYEIRIVNENKQIENYKAVIYPQGLLFQQQTPKGYVETINCSYINPSNILLQLPQGLNEIIVNKKIDKIVEILKRIDSQIKGISVSTNGLIYCDIDLEKLIPINVMGDGVKRILSLITTIILSKNGIVIIDEIENGFYPETLQTLWRAVFTAAKENNVQVFSTTHSYECIEAFKDAYNYDKHPQDKEQAKLYRLERNNENIFNVAQYDEEMLNTATKMNWEVR